MDIKIRKEKAPEIKLKKAAEIPIHKKNLIPAKEEDRIFLHKKGHSDLFGNLRIRDRSPDQDRRTAGNRSGESAGEKRKEPAGKKLQEYHGRGQAGRGS